MSRRPLTVQQLRIASLAWDLRFNDAALEDAYRTNRASSTRLVSETRLIHSALVLLCLAAMLRWAGQARLWAAIGLLEHAVHLALLCRPVR